MTLKRLSHDPRVLLASSLLAVAAAAQCASGYIVTREQEVLVRRGMSMAEVQATLGPPDRMIHYRNEPGPTFTYRVMGADSTVFEVNFAVDSTVASASERVEQRGP